VARSNPVAEACGVRDGTGELRDSLPPSRGARVLLAAGACALFAVLPVLWIWVLYASPFGRDLTWACAIALSGLAAGIGVAMIRILDHR
jgi:hypothetical protein